MENGARKHLLELVILVVAGLISYFLVKDEDYAWIYWICLTGILSIVLTVVLYSILLPR